MIFLLTSMRMHIWGARQFFAESLGRHAGLRFQG